jgi:putative DNA primase/helicase
VRLDAAFQTLMRGEFLERFHKVLSRTNTETVCASLLNDARLGSTRPVFIRVGGSATDVFLDLGREGSLIIRINALAVMDAEPKVASFFRPNGFKPLPIPKRKNGRTLAQILAALLPQLDSETLVLIAAWLVGAMKPYGPYAILQIIGIQGSAKSCLALLLKRVIDPNAANLRSLPRDERAQCRIKGSRCSTTSRRFPSPRLILFAASPPVARFATRKLYSDGEAFLIDVQRPVILTGVGDAIDQADLKSRTITIQMPPIESESRITEEEVWKRFDQAHGELLGCLVECVQVALQRSSTVEHGPLPRLADWFKWVLAAEPAMGFEKGLFERAFSMNEAQSSAMAVEASVVARALVTLMKSRTNWAGTASHLSEAARSQIDQNTYNDPRAWPSTAHHFASALRRLAPDLLRVTGIAITFGRNSSSRKIEIECTRVIPTNFWGDAE